MIKNTVVKSVNNSKSNFTSIKQKTTSFNHYFSAYPVLSTPKKIS